MKYNNDYVDTKGPMMNLFKKGKCPRTISVLTAVLMSGCSLLPEKSTLVAMNNANQYSDIQELSAYKKDVEEVLAMRSSINRLIELEQDLTFLLDEMSRFEEQNPNLEFARRSANEDKFKQTSEVVYSPNGVITQSQEGGTNASISDLKSLEQAISQAKEQTVLRTNRFAEREGLFDKPKMVEVETTAAKKFNSELLGIVPQQVNANKFSRLPNQSSKQQKSIVGPLLVDKNVSCDDITTNVSNSYGVHLASYGSQKSAIMAWNRIMPEYSNELCSGIAKTQTVLVQGKTYHRLNVGGYAEKRLAETVCIKLQKLSAYCKVVEFEGDMI